MYRNILEYVDGEYIITNPITQDNLKEMRMNMDETDLESFDNFVERHWGNNIKSAYETVSANAVASRNTEEKTITKRRGRPSKKLS